MNPRVLIFSAPSGSGKSTLISYLLEKSLELGLKFGFSISATSRKPRGEEQNGKEYYFLSVEEFKNRISKNEFLEWEEVYENNFYGTLKSEVQQVFDKGEILVFDLDVKGGVNIKKYFGSDAVSIFIKPPSIEELEKRLRLRSTDSEEAINRRVQKATNELLFEKHFDKVLVNDDIEIAKKDLLKIISQFK